MRFPTSLSTSTPLITTCNLLLHSRQFLPETRSAEKWRSVATFCASFRITEVPLWFWSLPYSYYHFCSIFLITRYCFFWIVFEGIVDWRAKSDIYETVRIRMWSEIVNRVEEKREINRVILNIDVFSFPINNSTFSAPRQMCIRRWVDGNLLGVRDHASGYYRFDSNGSLPDFRDYEIGRRRQGLSPGTFKRNSKYIADFRILHFCSSVDWWSL